MAIKVEQSKNCQALIILKDIYYVICESTDGQKIYNIPRYARYKDEMFFIENLYLENPINWGSKVYSGSIGYDEEAEYIALQISEDKKYFEGWFWHYNSKGKTKVEKITKSDLKNIQYIDGEIENLFFSSTSIVVIWKKENQLQKSLDWFTNVCMVKNNISRPDTNQEKLSIDCNYPEFMIRQETNENGGFDYMLIDVKEGSQKSGFVDILIASRNKFLGGAIKEGTEFKQ